MINFFLLIPGSPPPLSGLVAGAAERGAQGWYWKGGEAPCGSTALWQSHVPQYQDTGVQVGVLVAGGSAPGLAGSTALHALLLLASSARGAGTRSCPAWAGVGHGQAQP